MRRALDASLYLVLYELIGHSKGILFAAFVEGAAWCEVRLFEPSSLALPYFVY